MSARFQSTRDIILRTPDLEAAVSYYEKTLGLARKDESPTLVGFETGSFYLYVEPGEEHGPVLEFLVADVAEARDRLLDAGCTVVEEDDSVPRCYVRDRYGLVFNLRKR